MLSVIANVAQWFNSGNNVGDLPPVIFLTDTKRTPEPIKIANKLPPRAWVLLRHYGFPHRNELAHALKEVCRRKSLGLIVSDDPRLALSVGADGLHLPEYRLKSPTTEILSWKQTGRGILTCAVHNEIALHRAHRFGVDAALISPVFPTNSHNTAKNLGIIRFAALCQASKVPVYALGGVNAVTIKRLRGNDISGIGAIGSLR